MPSVSVLPESRRDVRAYAGLLALVEQTKIWGRELAQRSRGEVAIRNCAIRRVPSYDVGRSSAQLLRSLFFSDDSPQSLCLSVLDDFLHALL